MDIYSDRVHPSATLGPHAGGREALVQLDPDHPGFNDAAYRARRDTIARLALEYCDGDPAPTVPYTEEEHGVWSRVWNELGPLHERWACRAYLEALELVELDRSRIPQLAEVNAVIESRQGFQMLPVAGLIKAKNFLRYLGRGRFLSTQYIRHHSCPLYTPEPDIVHELVGHASSLAHPVFARLTRDFGRAANRTEDPQELLSFERLYWFTLEFGAVEEDGGVKAYGAGLLSSYGELGRFAKEADLAPLDIERIIATDYDPTGYQETIFVARGFERMAAEVTRWLGRF